MNFWQRLKKKLTGEHKIQEPSLAIDMKRKFEGVRIEGDEYCDFSENCHIERNTRVIAANFLTSPNDEKFITIGSHCWVGENAEIQSFFNSKIIIKDYSTIQDSCKILGDVLIEKYCVFAPNIFASSGNHYATIKSEWLIREQDAFVFSTDAGKKNHSNPIHIEEDCWLGWGVFVKPGIYIGRGAVIGAYTVITSNIPPYSIHVGAPNKEIKTRLSFVPPSEIIVSESNHLPYFYRGFAHKRFELDKSLKSNIIFSETESICTLKKGIYKSAIIFGIILQNPLDTVSLEVKISGYQITKHTLNGGNFRIHIDLEMTKEVTINAYLENTYTLIQLNLRSNNETMRGDYTFGIEKITMVS